MLHRVSHERLLSLKLEQGLERIMNNYESERDSVHQNSLKHPPISVYHCSHTNSVVCVLLLWCEVCDRTTVRTLMWYSVKNVYSLNIIQTRLGAIGELLLSHTSKRRVDACTRLNSINIQYSLQLRQLSPSAPSLTFSSTLSFISTRTTFSFAFADTSNGPRVDRSIMCTVI